MQQQNLHELLSCMVIFSVLFNDALNLEDCVSPTADELSMSWNICEMKLTGEN
jgi:hypothetical protein